MSSGCQNIFPRNEKSRDLLCDIFRLPDNLLNVTNVFTCAHNFFMWTIISDDSSRQVFAFDLFIYFFFEQILLPRSVGRCVCDHSEGREETEKYSQM